MLVNTLLSNYQKTLNINQNQTERDLTRSHKQQFLVLTWHPDSRGFYPLTILNYTVPGWQKTTCWTPWYSDRVPNFGMNPVRKVRFCETQRWSWKSYYPSHIQPIARTRLFGTWKKNPGQIRSRDGFPYLEKTHHFSQGKLLVFRSVPVW